MSRRIRELADELERRAREELDRVGERHGQATGSAAGVSVERAGRDLAVGMVLTALIVGGAWVIASRR